MDRHRGHRAEQDEQDEQGEPVQSGGCAAFGPLLEAYHYRILTPEQARSVAEHSSRCVACRAALDAYAATDRLIATAPTAPPGPALRQRLAARIAAARAQRSAQSATQMSIERTTVVSDANDLKADPRWTNTYPPMTPTRRRVQRLRVLLGTAAAVLIVALLAGTLLSHLNGGAGQPNGGRFTFPLKKEACAPEAIKAQLPANSALGSLAMVSPDEGWAVGGIVNPATLMPENTFILHYAHCAWTPLSTQYPGATLDSLSMGSATEGWALGSTDGDAPFALHYTKGVWRQVTPPGRDVLGGGRYSAVRMLSADEGWIVFNHLKDKHGYLSQGLLHLSHGKWSEVVTPFPAMSEVLPVAPDDAWVVGYASTTQQIPDLYHYHDGAWTKATVPSGVNIYTLRMISPNDIWASGQSDALSAAPRGAVLHYDGQRWQQVAVSASGHPEIVEAFDQDTSWAFTMDYSALNKVPPGDALIKSAQYQRNGSWRQVAWPLTHFSSIGWVTRVSPDAFWAIGSYSVVKWTPTGNGSYSGSGYGVSVLLHFADGAWHAYGQ